MYYLMISGLDADCIVDLSFELVAKRTTGSLDSSVDWDSGGHVEMGAQLSKGTRGRELKKVYDGYSTVLPENSL